MTDLQRAENIRCHPCWQKHMAALARMEAARRFCRHDVSHCLDVARLAWIENLERELGLQKDVVYAAALLHDLGRYAQMTGGEPHHAASARLAGEILPECGFSREETAEIAAAILGHRETKTAGDPRLLGVLYRADKASRCCWDCAARTVCNWSDTKKNLTLKG